MANHGLIPNIMGIQCQLVLIHGIATKRVEKPTNSDAFTFLQKRFPDATLFEYHFPLWSPDQRYEVSDFSQQARIILEELAEYRGLKNIPDLPLLFMGCDLGGSLIKQIICLATREPQYSDIMMNIRAIMFFGTPHKVTDMAPWEQHIIRLLFIGAVSAEDTVQLLQLLPQALENLSLDFATISHSFQLINFFQCDDPRSVNTTIAASCARLIAAGKNNIELDCDHTQFWEFNDEDQTTELICVQIVNAASIGLEPVRFQTDLFLQALAAIDPKTHRLRLVKASSKSLDWVLKHKSYTEWAEEAEASILHITGPPGSGTTVILSQILQTLLQKTEAEKTVILSFSFNKQDIGARTLDSLLVSFCRQFLLARPSLFHHIMSTCWYLILHNLITDQTLWSIFRSLTVHLSAFMPETLMICVIHSIHECDSFNDLLNRLLELMSITNSRFKIALTSNDSFKLQSPPDKTNGGVLNSQIDQGSNKIHDINVSSQIDNTSTIENLVKESLVFLGRDTHIWLDKDLQNRVVAKVCGLKANYLLAVRTMAILRNTATRSIPSSAHELLKTIPRNLDESYQQTFQAIPLDDWVQCAFRWIVRAVRPLSEQELAVAVALDEFGHQPFELLENYISVNIVADLRRVTGPLIKVIDNEVLLFHRSLRDYLSASDDLGGQLYDTKNPNLEENYREDPHLKILTICLEYLKNMEKSFPYSDVNMDDIKATEELPAQTLVSAEYLTKLSEKVAKPSPQKRNMSNTARSLFNYACLYWPEHYQLTWQASKIVASERVFLFLAEARLVTFWAREYNRLSGSSVAGDFTLDNCFQIACYFGFSDMLYMFSDITSDQAEPIELQNALGLATRKGHYDIVKFLVSRNIVNDDALGLAAANGFDNVMSLLATESSIEKPNKAGYTPLHQAACRGHQKAVEFLLNKGVNLDKTTTQGLTALQVACQTGQASIVQMLISRGSDVKAEDKDGYDGLKIAAQAGFTEIVSQLLLCKDVDPQKASKDGNIALHLATKFGHPSTVDILLEYFPGAMNLNQKKQSPIHIAAEAGYLEILRKLLCKVNQHDTLKLARAPDDDGNTPKATLIYTDDAIHTPLQLAAKNGHEQIVAELLNELENSPCNSAIALYLAAINGRAAVVYQLWSSGVREIVIDKKCNTALHYAANNGHDNVILLLPLMPNFAIDPKNEHGWTPLHMAANYGNLRAVKELLKLKANSESVTDTKETPLQLAAAAGHRFTSRALIDNLRVKSKVWNEHGRMAFQLAASKGHVTVAKELLDAGVKLESPLHDMALVANPSILEVLLHHNQWSCTESSEKEKYTPLHLAVLGNSLGSVNILREASVGLNARDHNKKTPLHIAAEKGYDAIAGSLIEAGAELNATDIEGRTALYIASYNGCLGVVRALLESSDPTRRANVEKRASQGWTPLHAAHDNPNVTKLLLSKNAEVDCQTTNSKSTPLLMAVYEYYDVADILLKHHADPNLTDASGETSVHRAVLGDAGFQMLELLKLHDANLDAERHDGSTPLHLAAERGDETLVKYFLKEGAAADKVSERFGTALIAAAEGGNVEVAKLILKKGADINAIGGKYHTALQAAAHNGKNSMVDWLLEEKAAVNLNVCGGTNSTPLEAAIKGRHSDIALRLLEHVAKPSTPEKKESLLRMAISSNLSSIVKRLIEDGVNVDYPGGTTESLLRLAVKSGDESIVQMILDAGAKDQKALEDAVSIGNMRIVEMFLTLSDGRSTKILVAGKRSLIHLAIEKGHLEIVKSLVQSGVDLSTRDRHGRTALTHAVYLGRNSIINYLIQSDGINVNDVDHYGLTPLGWAVIKQSVFVRELIEMRSDVNKADREGKTPLIYACMTDQRDIVQILINNKADPHIRDHRGRGALYWASRQASVEVFNSICQILELKQKNTEHCAGALCAALASRRNYFIDRLLQRYPDSWNIPDYEGWTPIYTAKQYGNDDKILQICDILVDKPAKPQNYPSRWSESDRSIDLGLDEAGTMITVGGPPSDPGETYAAVRADYAMVPISNLQNVYYFEVTIKKSSKPGSWGIGFTEEHTNLNAMLGWHESSWGYHGDDGNAVAEGFYTDYGPKYEEGDVIGCGVNFDKNIAFYTKNGTVIGQAFADIRGKLYPAISVDQCMVGSQLWTNFGKENGTKFAYTGSYLSEETLTEPIRRYKYSSIDGMELDLELEESP
ncbi:putative ankyrin repeat-containing protein [Trichoderma chlorosporum]